MGKDIVHLKNKDYTVLTVGHNRAYHTALSLLKNGYCAPKIQVTDNIADLKQKPTTL